MKFLNSAAFYKADVIIVGGDITGKAVVPIIAQPDGTFRAKLTGVEEVFKKQEEVQEFEKRVNAMGYYPYLSDEASWERMASDQDSIEKLLNELIKERVRLWMQWADQKLAGANVRCFISPGNDDVGEIDSILAESRVVESPANKIVKVDDYHEMLSLSNANITPWHCPRDITEEEFAIKIQELGRGLSDPANAIFNIHCPPYDSGLDVAPRLDENLKPILLGNEPYGPVGSTAVREGIQKYQPLLGLHGHVHESKGSANIGRTLCLNPGSEYSEGLLRGVLVELEMDRVRKFQFTAG